jgi:hypothetical protein
MICGFCGIAMSEYSEVKEDREKFYWCCERCHDTRAPHLIKIKRPDTISSRFSNAKESTSMKQRSLTIS